MSVPRALSLFLLLSALASAQSNEASISGVVSDAQGATIPGAQVSATQIETGVKTAVVTNASGFYSLRPLPIGAYVLSATAAGFRQYRREGLVLTTGQPLELAITLEVGNVTESVTVTAETPLLETRSSEASQLVESQTIEDMPLGDRRALNLVEITGAAVFIPNEDSTAKTQFSLAGGRAGTQMYWVDGGTGQNMRIGAPQMDIDPPIATLAEVKIMANAFSAEFGGSAGGVVVVNTKSGANRLQGSLSEYARNQVFDAPNFFAPVADGVKQMPKLRYNVFGGTIGGPLKRDKTFYFLAYEGWRRRDGSVRTLTVPSALERQGDFSRTMNSRGVSIVYDPSSGRRPASTLIRDPFPDNVIPASRFDATMKNMIPFYPLPNRAPDDQTGANNFRMNDVNQVTRDNITGKLDHNLSSRDKLSARVLYNRDVYHRSSVYPNPAAETNNWTDNWQTFFYGAWTRVVSSAVINELRYTYGYRVTHTFSPGFGGNWPSKLGFKGVSDDAFPSVQAGGYANLGSTTHERRQFPIKQTQIVDSLSWVRARHSLKFGGEVRPSSNYEKMRELVSGRYNFSRGFTGASGNAFSGNGFATLLLGTPTTFELRETDVLERSSRYLAWFAQDDWNATRGLTLNLGLRWEADTPLKDKNRAMNSFDPLAINPVAGVPGAVKFLGRNGWRATPYDADWNNFGPRVGFAWKLPYLRATVLRGGFGIFFAHPFNRTEANTATLGFERSAQLVLQDTVVTVPYFVAGGLPIPALDSPVLDDGFAAVPAGTNPNMAVTFLETNRRTGYSMQSNLRVQHELPGHAIVEIGYIGNLSRKLPSSNLSTNQIRPEKMGSGTGYKDRPFPQFSNVNILAPALGVSSYHAAALKAEKRFSHGFNLLATYTFAKFLDNCDSGGKLGDEANAYSDFYNRRADWGPSENDIRQRLTWSSVYQFPFGRGQRFLKRGLGRTLLGGWSLGVVAVMQSGGPVTVTTQVNTTYSNSAGALRADILRNPNLPADRRSLQRWFDTGAFQQPASYVFGNQGLGQVRADGIANVNSSIIRSFRLGERKTLQFRGELFNLLNHANFTTPGRTFEGPGFGIVSGARAARQIQLGLRLTY